VKRFSASSKSSFFNFFLSEEAFVNINEIDKETDFDLDALERSWFAAHRVAEAARAELQIAGVNETAPNVLADLLGRIDNAELQKHEIMRKIHALEDSLIE
jgi:hypothetical protein